MWPFKKKTSTADGNNQNSTFIRSESFPPSSPAREYKQQTPNKNNRELHRPDEMLHHQEDKKVLEKYDVSLYQSDLLTLSDNSWLSDAIINFLALHLYEELTNDVKNKVNVVPSTSCDIIKYSVPPQTDILKSLNVTPKLWQFFMFNNNSNFGNHHGTHWSLLVFHPGERSFYYVDSAGRYVPDLVNDLAKKIALQWSLPFKGVESIPCNQQNNGYDCGIHLIENLNCILKNIKSGRVWNEFQSMLNPYNYMTSRRYFWKTEISNLAKEEGVYFFANDEKRAPYPHEKSLHKFPQPSSRPK